MTYQAERAAIETYLNAQWAGATAIGLDRQKFTPAVNTIGLFIQNGQTVQGSIGRASNRIEYVGLAQILIYTEAGKGSAAWRGHAESLEGIFRNARITSAGVVITDPADEFIRFSPRDQHPYISGHSEDVSLTTTTLNVPFSRYEYR